MIVEFYQGYIAVDLAQFGRDSKVPEEMRKSICLGH